MSPCFRRTTSLAGFTWVWMKPISSSWAIMASGVGTGELDELEAVDAEGVFQIDLLCVGHGPSPDWGCGVCSPLTERNLVTTDAKAKALTPHALVRWLTGGDRSGPQNPSAV